MERTTKQPSELVDSRELTTYEEDRFRHRDVAHELAELVATVETPANVALYGPWGSGKSGVANLVGERLDEKDFKERFGEVTFARFDAFKYAEVPLRRHFLSQLARELLSENATREFRSSLYESSTKTDIKFESLDVVRALRAFAIIMGVGVLITAVIVATIAALVGLWDEGTTFGSRFLTYLGGAVGFAFAPGAVLAGLFAIAGKTLPVTRQSDTPSTDEQFEEKFRELLKELKTDRLVVFVDELDRCPAHRVVDVLDTVRTFLDVTGTVFVVAADQHVLEQALSKRVQQTTPTDATNPYYSSGSAYLDKVFHYQLSLPPLLPGRITRYAVDLVQGRPGVWATVNADSVVSVLIPTHVRSPRRVKTLLNNFVIAYRLAEQRFENDHLATSPRGRAQELAKLVCLRTEFPVFARELALSTRLPELFVALVEDPRTEQPSQVPDDVWEKARAFATGRIAPDEMLDERPEGQPPELSETGVPETDREEGASSDAGSALRKQLHHYLLKTRYVTNPHRDLLFLESQSAMFDLDEALAESLEDAAVGGRTDDLVALVDEQDERTQTQILSYLSQLTREAFPGVEGQNLVGSLLVLAGSRPDDVVDLCANDAIEAVRAHRQRSELRSADLRGALVLGLRSNRHAADELVAAIVDRSEALTDPELGMAILEHATELLPGRMARVGAVLANRLTSTATSSVAAQLLSQMDEHGVSLAEAARPTLIRLIDDSFKDEAAEDAGVEEDAKAEGKRDELLVALSAMVNALGPAEPAVGETLARSLLESRSKPVWRLAAEFLVQREAVEFQDTAVALVKRSSEVALNDACEWLKVVPTVGTGTDGLDALHDIVAKLWSEREQLGDAYDEHSEVHVATMKEVSRLQPAETPEGLARLARLAEDDIESALTNVAQVNQAAAAWDRVRRYVEEDLFPAEVVADFMADRLASRLRAQPNPPATGQDKAYRDFFERWALWVASRCSSSTAADLADAFVASPWFPSPRKESLAVRVASRAQDGVPSPFTPAQMTELTTKHQDGIARGASAWLVSFAGEPSDAYAVLEPLLRSCSYSPIVRDGVKRYVDGLDEDGRLVLAGLEIDSSADGRIDLDFLRDVNFHETDERRAAEAIAEAFERTATNNERRRDLLDAWSVLSPTSKTVRQRLIDSVLLRTIAEGGKQGFDHVRARPQLWRDPEGRKTVIKEAFRGVVGGKDKDDRLEQLLREHGVVKTRRKGFFGLTKEEIDED